MSLRLAFALLLGPSLVWAELLADPETVIREKFPGAEIATENLLLTEAEQARIIQALGKSIGENVFTMLIAKRDEKVLGYAMILTRKVRTKDTTALYHITPKGTLDGIDLVTFYEPPEYQPKAEWLSQFKGLKSDKPIRVNQEVRVVTGATLTAEAYALGARLALAIWRERFAPKKAKK